MRTSEQIAADYVTYRGRCQELAKEACAKDPLLRIVRGKYYCPIWDNEDWHWWCVKPDGTIVDPSRLQFPSGGSGLYTEFDGWLECSNCGKRMREEEADIDENGRYFYCSHLCHGQFIGIY